jgi:sodium-dependent dicarboxylate transporter 2/3/5
MKISQIKKKFIGSLPHFLIMMKQNFTIRKMTGMVSGPLLYVLILLFFKPEGLSNEGIAVLAGTCWIAIWWVTEAIPIPATSLLPIVLFPLSGAISIGQTTASYGHKMVFLYMGGFMIALAMEKWNLHKRIALTIIQFVGTNLKSVILGFMLSTALLSMWISNTATTMMMLPIALAVARQFGEFFTLENTEEGQREGRKFGLSLMLGIAYAASIGGMATLIGTPTNAIFSAVAREYYNTDVAFADWFIFGLPISAVLLLVCWLYLTYIAFPSRIRKFEHVKETIGMELEKLGRIKKEEKRVIVVFSVTAFSWITRSFILSKFIPFIDDTIIAITGALVLFLIPARNDDTILDWTTARKLPWGILLLFGGGLAIAAGFSNSGLAAWIGQKIEYFSGANLFIILLVVTMMMNFLTEITSNMATASILLPILATIATALGFHPYTLMISACLAASCAFMLPVGTPPNAIVFSSGYIRIQDMVRAGFWLNIISIFVITLAMRYLLPAIWDIDLFVSP